MGDPVNKVRTDYRASRHSGTRPASSIKVIVIHDAEIDDDLLGAEKVGAYFQSRAAKGSTHYGIDDNTTQQYLPDAAIPWGAPGANTNGLHMELMGKASHTRKQWIDHHGPMFDRAGWLLNAKAAQYGIPLRLLSVSEYKAGKKGIVTHNLVSVADGPGGSTHTDPGKYFPMDVLLAKALHYRGVGNIHKPKPKAQPYPLPEGHVFARDPEDAVWRHDGTDNARDKACVQRIQRAVGAEDDGVYGNETAERVTHYQRAHHLDADGLTGPDTWRSITKG